MKLNLKDKTIDVDRNIEITAEEIAELLKQAQEEVFYKIGDKFRFMDSKNIYRLSALNRNMAVLVKTYAECSWYVGVIWLTPLCTEVDNLNHITQEEFARIANRNPQYFNLIKS